jgi:tetratricopeptide (TPR) repeat protein
MVISRPAGTGDVGYRMVARPLLDRLEAVRGQVDLVAQRRDELDEAEELFRKAADIAEEIGDRPGMAMTYHQLGMVEQWRGDLGSAEGWYRKALAIKEEIRDRPRMMSTYHQLGEIARLRGRLDEAEEWNRNALTLAEEIGDRSSMASGYGSFGLLAEDRGQLPEALAWTVRCVALFDEFPHPSTGPGPGHLARLTQLLGMSVLEGTWRQVTGNELPRAVRAYVQEQLKEGQ